MVQYVGFVDCVDTEGGHGTHVAGSAAGALSETSPGGHFGDGVSSSTEQCLLYEKKFPGGLVNGWICPARSTWSLVASPSEAGAVVLSVLISACNHLSARFWRGLQRLRRLRPCCWSSGLTPFPLKTIAAIFARLSLVGMAVAVAVTAVTVTCAVERIPCETGGVRLRKRRRRVGDSQQSSGEGEARHE